MATQNTLAGAAGQAAALPATPAAAPATASAATNPAASSTDKPAPAFHPFEWCDPHDRFGKLHSHEAPALACKVFDIAQGAKTILEILECDDSNADFAEFSDGEERPILPILTPVVRATLMRMAITSLELLAGEASGVSGRWNASIQQHNQGGSL